MNREQTFPRLKGDMEADILIVGGGVTGVFTGRKSWFPEIGRDRGICYSFAYGGAGLLIGFASGKILADQAQDKSDAYMKAFMRK